MSKISPEVRKQTLLDGLTDAREQIIQAVISLPDSVRNTPFLGVWSAHDIAAHLTGWDFTNLDAIFAIQSGCLPSFYAAYDPDWRTYNSTLVARYKRTTIDETIAGARGSHRQLLEALLVLPAADYWHDYGVRSTRGRRVTVQMLLEAEAGDERKHAVQVSAFAASLETR